MFIFNKIYKIFKKVGTKGITFCLFRGLYIEGHFIFAQTSWSLLAFTTQTLPINYQFTSLFVQDCHVTLKMLLVKVEITKS